MDRAMGKVPFGELVNSGATPLPQSEFFAPAREISFAEILCPDGSGGIQGSDFFKHFCAKQMLHMPQEDRTRFEHLLSWQAINDILSLNILDELTFRVARDGRDIPPSLYRQTHGKVDLIDSRKLHALLKQNASIGLNRVHTLSPPIRRLAVELERALGQKVNVNSYMTFGPGGAFAMHYDSHDVLVLQVHGSKHWFIYEQPEAFPIEYDRKSKPTPREVEFETVLQAGDVLYVPRGTYHRAAVTDTDSVHLTFGIHTNKGLKFIDRVRVEAEKEPLFREDILPVRGAEALAEQERALKARLIEIINSIPLSEFAETWQSRWKPIDSFRLGPKEDLQDHTLLASLIRNPHAWRESYTKNGKEPSPAAQQLVECLIEKQSATVGDLKAELSGVLDEDTIKSTLAELVDDCWIEVVR